MCEKDYLYLQAEELDIAGMPAPAVTLLECRRSRIGIKPISTNFHTITMDQYLAIEGLESDEGLAVYNNQIFS